MVQPIVFYDLNRVVQDPKDLPWNPNTFKTRLTLNYKNLPYRTVRLEYPDIARVSIEQGAAPSGKWPDGSPRYTVPMIYDPNTRVAIADSAEIAKYLDRTYPDTPRLFPEGTLALQHIALDFIGTNINFPLAMAIPPERVGLTPESLAHLRKSLVKLFGVSHDGIDPEPHWGQMEEGLGKYAGYLALNGSGGKDLLMGEKICFADMQLAAILLMGRSVCGKDSKEWAMISGWHGGRWKRYIEQFEKYTSSDQ